MDPELIYKFDKLAIKDEQSECDCTETDVRKDTDKIDCFIPSGRIRYQHITNWSIWAKFLSDFASLVIRCNYVHHYLPQNDIELYFEVRLITGKICQVGWVDLNGFTPRWYDGEGVGDDKSSWAYDGSRCCKFYNGIQTPYGKQWRKNDIVGCFYNPSRGTISYALNGHKMGDAFADVPVQTELCPAISCIEHEEVELMVHNATFQYFPDDYSAMPFHYMLTNDIGDDSVMPGKPDKSDSLGAGGGGTDAYTKALRRRRDTNSHRYRFVNDQRYTPPSSVEGNGYLTPVSGRPEFLPSVRNASFSSSFCPRSQVSEQIPGSAISTPSGPPSYAPSPPGVYTPVLYEQTPSLSWGPNSVHSSDPSGRLPPTPALYGGYPSSSPSQIPSPGLKQQRYSANSPSKSPKRISLSPSRWRSYQSSFSAGRQQQQDEHGGRLNIDVLTGDATIHHIDNWIVSVIFNTNFSTIGIQYKSTISSLPTSSHAIYFEVKIKTSNMARVGWANLWYFAPNSLNLQGAGDDDYSWSYDGSRKEAYHQGDEEPYGDLWSCDDIIGCKFDPTTGRISYTKNGRDLGVAFEVDNNNDNLTLLCPVITCNRKEILEIYAHHNDLEYLPVGCIPLHELLPTDPIMSLSSSLVREDSPLHTYTHKNKPKRLAPAPACMPEPVLSPASIGKVNVIKMTGNVNVLHEGNIISASYASEFGTIALDYHPFAILPISKGIYYEVCVTTAASAQIGWADIYRFQPREDYGEGVGDDEHSWSYDGFRPKKFHGGDEKSYGIKWSQNDIVGCKFHPSKGTISFSLNGSDMGTAFEGIPQGFKICPVITGDENETIEIRYHQDDLKHLPHDSIPLYDMLIGKYYENRALSSSTGTSPISVASKPAPPKGEHPNLIVLTGKVRILNRGSIIWALFSSEFATASFKDIGILMPLSSKAIYYEVKVISGGIAQIGWADMNHFEPSDGNGIGTGDDEFSWSYDGSRREKFHDGVGARYGKKWKENDIVGCKFYPYQGILSYSLNGSDMGIAFKGMDTKCKYYPAITCDEFESIEILYNRHDINHLPSDSIALYDALIPESKYTSALMPASIALPTLATSAKPPATRDINRKKVSLTTMTGKVKTLDKVHALSVLFSSQFATICFNNHVDATLPSSKAIYYEVKIISAKTAQIGWADINRFAPSDNGGEGAGDDKYSWSYDGSRCEKFHQGFGLPYGKKWQKNDIVGCKFHPCHGTISYSLNGSDMGFAFTGLKCSDISRYCPVMTCEKNENIDIIYHRDDMKHLPIDSIPLYDMLVAAHSAASPRLTEIFLSTVSGKVNVKELNNTVKKVKFVSEFATTAIQYLAKSTLPTSKAIYYEIKIITAGHVQLGWADLNRFEPSDFNGKGAGDDRYSWGYDGAYAKIFHRGAEQSYGKKWKTNDIIGCKFHSSSGKISYSLNGADMGLAFKVLKKNYRLQPVMTGEENQAIEIITHQSCMKYFSPKDSFSVYDVVMGNT